MILFPGGIGQLNSYYDAMLFMSVISGRNPHYLIGEQVLAAPIVKDLDIETIFKTIDTSSGQTWFGTNREKIDWFKECYHDENTMGILKKDVEAYVDAFENVSELDNFVSGELSSSIIKAINNMPLAK